MSERYARFSVRPCALVVRPAMRDGIGHRADDARIARRFSENAGDTAHGSAASTQSCLEPAGAAFPAMNPVEERPAPGRRQSLPREQPAQLGMAVILMNDRDNRIVAVH